MQGKQYGNAYRTTVVCVDDFAGSVLSGRIYNPAIEGGQQFGSLMDFLVQMETLLDGMSFPSPSPLPGLFPRHPSLRHRPLMNPGNMASWQPSPFG